MPWEYGYALVAIFSVKLKVDWAIWLTVIVVADDEIASCSIVAALVAVTEHVPAEVLDSVAPDTEQFPELTTYEIAPLPEPPDVFSVSVDPKLTEVVVIVSAL
jgi:hypothetical protein